MCLGRADAGRRREAHVPVLDRHRQRSAPTRHQRGGGRQLQRRAVDRARLGHVAQRKVILDGLRLDRAVEPAMCQQRLELRPEQQVPVGQQRVEQRLHSESVAREEQLLLPLVPQREREHAAEALDAVRAPRLPGVNDDLRVAPGAEHVSERLQFRDQLLVVVDLAVVDNDDRVVLVVERLLARRDIDDRKASMAKSDARRDMQAAFVGSTVMLALVHAHERRTVDLATATQVNDAGDSAHLSARPAARRAVNAPSGGSEGSERRGST